MNLKKPQKTVDKAKEKEVKTHIDNHHEIDTSEVSVHVLDGSVTLKGEVDNGQAKNLVGNIVTNEVQKIKGVDNQINARRDISQAPENE